MHESVQLSNLNGVSHLRHSGFFAWPYKVGIAALTLEHVPKVLEFIPPAPRVLWCSAFVSVVVEVAGKVFDNATLQTAQEVVVKAGHVRRH